MDKLTERIITCDVLIVGGGIAGLMAAIKASDFDVNVVVVDKQNIERSGCAGVGCDHFQVYIPEIHGPSIDPYLGIGDLEDEDIVRTIWTESSKILKLWEDFGIPVKPRGEFEFVGHRKPGYPGFMIKYEGQNQKRILMKEAQKRGIEVINRVMVHELLVNNGRIAGAVGVSTREPEVYVFLAKSIFLGNAYNLIERLYPSIVGGILFNTDNNPSNTGDGQISAYRAGAEVTGAEFIRRHRGVRYFCRCGQGTWIGIITDAYGNEFIPPYLGKPNRITGPPLLTQEAAESVWKSGRGPIYLDGRGMSEDDLQYMMWGLMNEGNSALVDYMRSEGIDPRTTRIEWGMYGYKSQLHVRVTSKCETTIPGLYCEYPRHDIAATSAERKWAPTFMADITAAAVSGWIGGEEAAKYARSTELTDIEIIRKQIDRTKQMYHEILNRKAPYIRWQDANIALNQIMIDYAGDIRAETTLRAGLKHIKRFKNKFARFAYAENMHELMRCLEVLNLFDIAELTFIAMAERKESRGYHFRIDFPKPNPQLAKLLIMKKANGQITLRWENPRRIKGGMC